MLTSEVTDLRLVLDSTEKRYVETKKDFAALQQSSQQVKAELEAKVRICFKISEFRFTLFVVS